MKKKSFEAVLFSTVGIGLMLLVVVALNIIGGAFKQRIDLTADKLYTLSDGTRAILGKLDTKVKIRFYCTQDDNNMPVVLKTYAQRIEDLLNEYKQNSHGKIIVEKLNPLPDTDAEDSANLDGVQGEATQSGEKVYLGLAVSCLNEKFALPFLSPDKEKLLEYDLSRAISRVANPSKPVIGVMTALPIFGQPANPMQMRMGQMQGQEPWLFITELKKDFEVKQVEMTAETIPDDVKVLLVIHPKDITDAAQFGIDQFVLRGGKLIAFLDPLSIIDAQKSGGNPMMGGAPPSSSSLDKLLKAWGIDMDKSKVVADQNFISKMNRGQRAESQPAVLSMNREGINTNEIATSQIDSLLMLFPGAFTGTPAEGLKETVLLHSTPNSALVEGFLAQMSGEAVLKDFKSGGKELNLAIRLTGKFKTAFPGGKPADKPADDKDKKPDAKPADFLKESTGENSVVLIGDSDILYDQFCFQVQDFFGQRVMIPRNGNFNLAQNIIEQMSGDSNLINSRSRATMNRPFTLVRKMEAEAQENYRNKIKQMEDSLQETQRRLNELQQNKDKSQRFIISPEQQKEVDNFRKTEAETKKQLKELRKNLRQDIDSLENKLKWSNILIMPFLVAFFGIGLVVFKSSRTAAK